jgi:acetyltransferase-like isoleucine patch superfamily enzyme
MSASSFNEVFIGKNVQMLGEQFIRIGRGSCIGNDSWLNVCRRDGQASLIIGDCVLIGRRGVLNTGYYLEIGSYCAFGPNVYVGNADHDYTSNLTIGRGSVVGANSVVTSDVPPFTVIAGNPGRIVRMYDPVLQKWVRTRDSAAREAVMKNRSENPLPGREGYKRILDKSDFQNVMPIVAGPSEGQALELDE